MTVYFIGAGPGDLDRSLPAIREFGAEESETLVNPRDFLVAEPYRTGRYPIDVLHTVTRCDLSTPDLECSGTAIAGSNSVFLNHIPRSPIISPWSEVKTTTVFPANPASSNAAMTRPNSASIWLIIP